MEDRAVAHSSFVIERTYTATPERVFAAFADPHIKRRWFAEDRGVTVESHRLEFRVGGSEQSRYRFKEGSQFAGATLANDSVYLDIVPQQRIVMAYTMSMNQRIFSASLATFELQPAGKGTKLTFTEQAAFFEHADGPELRQKGWSHLLDALGSDLAR